jgi:hypothetical protein
MGSVDYLSKSVLTHRRKAVNSITLLDKHNQPH